MGKTQAGRDADAHTHTRLQKTFPCRRPPSLCLLTHIPAWLCHWNSAEAGAATVHLILMRLCEPATEKPHDYARNHSCLLPVYVFLSIFPTVFVRPTSTTIPP